jgi:hypothetical protein
MRFSLFVLSAAAASFSAAVAPLAAQTPVPKAAVAGTVTDSAGVPIGGAFVQVSQSMGESGGEVRTGTDGRFVIPDLESDGPYVVAVRKIGYRPMAFYDLQLKAGDTTRITFKLTRTGTALARVTVQGTKGSALASKGITSEEIDKNPVRSALDVIDRNRPTWLRGGLGECQAPDKVFINGIRRDYPGEPITELLYDINADNIQEMRYADCHAKLPINRQNAIYIVTKPGLSGR